MLDGAVTSRAEFMAKTTSEPGNGEPPRCEAKVCGVRNAAIAETAVENGAAYIGLIFAPESVRAVDDAAAEQIAAAVGCAARLVGVFVNSGVDEIKIKARRFGLGVAQLHGAYGDDAVQALTAAGLEVWLLDREGAETSCARTVLVDGRDGAQCGGTGKLADWSRVAALKAAGKRVALAGGIGPENIAAALASGCDVLDMNSKLERKRGVKDGALVAAALRIFRECVGRR